MFAHRVSDLQASGIRRIFELAAEIDNPINLSIGQAHYDVPEPAKAAAISAIENGHNRYTVTQGLPELNTGVRRYVQDKFGLETESTFITSGTSGGLLLAFLALIDRGDEVLLPDPYFVSYLHIANLCEADVQFYHLNDRFQLDLTELVRKITPRTKAILVNSPSNPTGGAFPAAQIEALVELCRKNDVLILSDEIYADFCYDAPHVSPLSYTENAILLSGLSKTWGMAGWRLGYVMGPEKYLTKMQTLQQFTLVCAPAPLQIGGVAALESDIAAELAAYRAKRDRIYNALKDKYACVQPSGSFYIFPKVPQGMDDMAFIERALEHKLLIVPGSAFSSRTDHFRVSFAADDATLERGIAVLRELV